MSVTLNDIIKWHEQTFPEATLEGQIKKFIEEQNEFYDSYTEDDKSYDISELADMLIVLCGISRFSFIEFVRRYDDFMDSFIEANVSPEHLQKELDAKMEVNFHRKWNGSNGEYKHVKE